MTIAPQTRELRQKLLLCIYWISSMLIIGGLLWFFTQNYRLGLLVTTVNAELYKYNTHIIEPSIVNSRGPVSAMSGMWFNMQGTTDKAYIFTIIRNGIAAVCVALVDSNGTVKEIVPIGGNARQVFNNMPAGFSGFYKNRIESSVRLDKKYRERRL